jgi:hypothetical protein
MVQLYRELLDVVPTERTVWEGDDIVVHQREASARELGEQMAALADNR